MTEMWLLVRREVLELLVELLRRRPGHSDDELLQELLISQIPVRRKPIVKEIRSGKRKRNGKRA